MSTIYLFLFKLMLMPRALPGEAAQASIIKGTGSEDLRVPG